MKDKIQKLRNTVFKLTESLKELESDYNKQLRLDSFKSIYEEIKDAKFLSIVKPESITVYKVVKVEVDLTYWCGANVVLHYSEMYGIHPTFGCNYSLATHDTKICREVIKRDLEKYSGYHKENFSVIDEVAYNSVKSKCLVHKQYLDNLSKFKKAFIADQLNEIE